jgi:hypothetical protein
VFAAVGRCPRDHLSRRLLNRRAYLPGMLGGALAGCSPTTNRTQSGRQDQLTQPRTSVTPLAFRSANE